MSERAITSEHVTSEQICARPAGGAASLVDPWGQAHPIGPCTLVGRDARRCGLAVLHPSVSALHAELECDGGVWTVFDRGSRNGVFVDGVRVTRATLRNGAQVRFAEVSFDFWTPALPAIPRRSRRQTAEIPVARQATVVSTLGRTATIAHFAERGVVTAGETSVELSRRESNVRELVRRLRRKLVGLGLRDVVGSRQGVGYRLEAEIVSLRDCGAVCGHPASDAA